MPIQLANLIVPGSPFLKAVYAGNMVQLWFTSAVVHFGFRSEFMMRKLTTRKHSPDPVIAATPGGDAWHHDITRYLGGINSSIALFAAFRLFSPQLTRSHVSFSQEQLRYLDVLSLLVFGMANASQAFLNFTVGAQTDRWIVGHGFDRITVLDAFFTVVDWGCALAIVL